MQRSIASTEHIRAFPVSFSNEKTGLAKYKTAATTLRNMYVGAGATYPNTAEGHIFWHKNNGTYNDIVLADGIYMLHPFLVKYGKMFNDAAAIDTAVNQTLFVYNKLYNSSTKLLKHAWNPTRTQSWANSAGVSTTYWSRGMGWFCVALVDILKNLPANHPRRAQLITALGNLCAGLQTYQDATTGLWYQVIDKKNTLTGNFLETSGSAMFVYTLKTAVDSGWIASAYLTVAQKAWNYLKNTANGKITVYTDGYPKVSGFAPAMGVQTNDAAYVQTSLQPVSCPGTAHPHGYGAILLASSAMEFPVGTGTARMINNEIPVSANAGISILQNPVVRQQLSVRMNQPTAGNYNIRLLNASGQLILQQSYQAVAGQVQTLSIQLPAVKPGAYYLQFIGNHEVKTKSLIIE